MKAQAETSGKEKWIHRELEKLLEFSLEQGHSQATPKNHTKVSPEREHVKVSRLEQYWIL